MDRILVTGATGFVGRRLVEKLLDKGRSVVATTRSASKVRSIFGGRPTAVEWNPSEGPPPEEALRDIGFVVNLMGENIGQKRWSRAQKQEIRDSRILGTRHLIEGIKALSLRPQAFVSTSAIGYYRVNGQETLTEQSPPDTTSFLGRLCTDWEREASQAPCGRLVVMRTGVVLERDGGALAKLDPIFRLGLGGRAASGRQMMSWIHLDDLVHAYIYALEEPLQGPFNAVSPKPVDNLTFSRTLAHTLRRPCLFPAPAAALRIAMGEMSTIVIDGQKIAPDRLLDAGFRFRFPAIGDALEDIYRPKPPPKI